MLIKNFSPSQTHSTCELVTCDKVFCFAENCKAILTKSLRRNETVLTETTMFSVNPLLR